MILIHVFFTVPVRIRYRCQFTPNFVKNVLPSALSLVKRSHYPGDQLLVRGLLLFNFNLHINDLLIELCLLVLQLVLKLLNDPSLLDFVLFPNRLKLILTLLMVLLYLLVPLQPLRDLLHRSLQLLLLNVQVLLLVVDFEKLPHDIDRLVNLLVILFRWLLYCRRSAILMPLR